jgi:hypothetical protein
MYALSLAWSSEVWGCAKDVTNRRNARIIGLRVGMAVLGELQQHFLRYGTLD